jgi:hypothetical protein
VRPRWLLEPEDRRDHPLHLRLLGPPVAADGLLYARRRVLSAVDPERGGRDENGAAGLSDGERGAGVDADERLLEDDRMWPKLFDQLGDAVEDRLQAQLRALLGGRLPPAEVHRPEAVSSFADDSEPARSRAWIDAENRHGDTLGTASDVPALLSRAVNRSAGLLLLALVAAGCGGGADGTRVFERAQDGLSHVRTIRAHLVVNAHVPIEQTATVPASVLPLRRLHLARWAKHPRRYDCEADFECARADVDVSAAVRELEPILPPLPFDPGSVDSAKLEIAIGRDDGVPHRARLKGDLLGLQFEVELKLSPSRA